MNLIEKLGGYEAAKEKYQALGDSDVITIGSVEFSAKDYFEDEFLQYRRDNNIFEVGDVIVHPSMTYGYLYEIYEIKGILIKVQCLSVGGRKSVSFKSDIRHATPEEIKEGKRL